MSGTTTGDYDASPFDRGTVKAIWSRAAGSKDGTCTLQMKSAMFGQLPDFVHAFEIIEFTGPLNYTPDTNKVSGTLTLTQTGDSTSLLAGPIGFTKSLTNRFDKLTLQHEVWTNASADMFKISNDVDFFLNGQMEVRKRYDDYVNSGGEVKGRRHADHDPHDGVAAPDPCLGARCVAPAKGVIRLDQGRGLVSAREERALASAF